MALAFRKALADAVEDRLLRSNPAERAHRMPTDRPEMQTWSKEELQAFLTATDADPARALSHALWRLAALTGMRRGEILGLRLADIDLEAGRLSVQQQLLSGGISATLGPPKTKAGRRSISVDPGTAAVLRERRATWRDEKLAFGPAYQDHDLVFCRPDGRPLGPDLVTHQFETRGGWRAYRGSGFTTCGTLTPATYSRLAFTPRSSRNAWATRASWSP